MEEREGGMNGIEREMCRGMGEKECDRVDGRTIIGSELFD